MEGGALAEGRQFGSGLYGEREGELVRRVGAVAEQAGEEEEGEARIGGGGVGADDDIPGEEIGSGDVVEHPAGVAKVGGGGEGAGGEEAAGRVRVAEEAEAKHAGVDSPDAVGVEAPVVVQKRENRMVLGFPPNREVVAPAAAAAVVVGVVCTRKRRRMGWQNPSRHGG